MPTVRVDELERWRHAAGQPFVAEFHERKHRRKQVLAALGEEILLAAFPVAPALHQDVVFDEHGQPRGQGLPGDAEPALEFLELPDAEEGFADDEKGPGVQNDLHRLADRAMPLDMRLRLTGRIGARKCRIVVCYRQFHLTSTSRRALRATAIASFAARAGPAQS